MKTFEIFVLASAPVFLAGVFYALQSLCCRRILMVMGQWGSALKYGEPSNLIAPPALAGFDQR